MDRLPVFKADAEISEPSVDITPKRTGNLDIVADLKELELQGETPLEDDSPFIMPPTRQEVKEEKKEEIVKEEKKGKPPAKKVVKERKEQIGKPKPIRQAKVSRRRRVQKEPEPSPPPSPIPEPSPPPKIKEAEVVIREIARNTDDFEDFVKKMDRYEKMKKEAFIRKQKEDEERTRKEKELEEHYYQKFKQQEQKAKQFVEVPIPKKEKASYGLYDNYF